MKYRFDFVTNSSSSSFIVHTYSELVSDDGKTTIQFDTTKGGGGINVDYNAPLFKEFVNELYLNTGKKPKPANLASSEKMLKDYAAFLHEKKPDKYSFSSPASFVKEESKRESGEFCGGALENFWYDCKDCFHPRLRALIGEDWSLFDYFQDIRFMYYTPCYIEKKVGKIKYNYVRFNYNDNQSGSLHDDTERFFRMIFEHFDKPQLDIDEMAAHLKLCGLTQEQTDAIRKKGYRVMYCSNKTNKNDKGNSIVLIDPESEEVIAKPMYEYLK